MSFEEKGVNILRSLGCSSVFLYGSPRDLVITGTSGPKVADLESQGFRSERAVTFSDLGIGSKPEPGHEGRLHFGSWHGRYVAVSSGRMHLYNGGEDLGRWLSVIMAARGGGKRIISLSAVGGQGLAKKGMIVMPRKVRCSEIPTVHMASGEFPDTESPLGYKIDLEDHPRHEAFESAALTAKLEYYVGSRHQFVPGRALVTGSDRDDAWHVFKCLTSGMSLIPLLQVINLANNALMKSGEEPIRVMPALLVSDTGSHVDADDFGKFLQECAPKLTILISELIQAEW